MKNAFASAATHGVIVGAMAWGLSQDAGHVAGSAGLAGNPSTHFEVTMESAKPVKAPPLSLPTEVKKAPVEKVVTAPIADEGIAVVKELPTEVKHPKPREIETPPVATPPQAVRSAGTTASLATGMQGQGGTGTTAAERLGNAAYTDRLGLYLQKMQRKIQSNLGSAGYVAFPTSAKLLIELRKDGTVAKISVTESSGDAALDRLAINAVQKSLPFDPWERDQKIQLPVVIR